MAHTSNIPPFVRQRIAFAIVLLSTKPPQLTVAEYFALLRAQINQVAVKDWLHLQSLAGIRVQKKSLKEDSKSNRPERDETITIDSRNGVQGNQDAVFCGTLNAPTPDPILAAQGSLPYTNSPETLQVFTTFGDSNSLTSLIQSFHLLSNPRTPLKERIQAAYTLSTTFIDYLRSLTSNPMRPQDPDCNVGIQSVFGTFATVYSSLNVQPDAMQDLVHVIALLVNSCLILITESSTRFAASAFGNECQRLRDYRESISQGILLLSSTIPAYSILHEAMLVGLLSEVKRVRCNLNVGVINIMARNDALWYLSIMIEEVLKRTDVTNEIVRMQLQQLVVEGLCVEEKEKDFGDWVTRKTCLLLCGFENLKGMVHSM